MRTYKQTATFKWHWFGYVLASLPQTGSTSFPHLCCCFMHLVKRARHFSKSTTVTFLLACLRNKTTIIKIKRRNYKWSMRIFRIHVRETNPQLSICISHSFLYMLPSDPQVGTSGSLLQSKGQAFDWPPDVRSSDTQYDIGTSNTCLLNDWYRGESGDV